jgi:hypothetical protein
MVSLTAAVTRLVRAPCQRTCSGTLIDEDLVLTAVTHQLLRRRL